MIIISITGSITGNSIAFLIIPYNTYFSIGIYFRLFPQWAVNRENITCEKMFSRLSL